MNTGPATDSGEERLLLISFNMPMLLVGLAPVLAIVIWTVILLAHRIAWEWVERPVRVLAEMGVIRHRRFFWCLAEIGRAHV